MENYRRVNPASLCELDKERSPDSLTSKRGFLISARREGPHLPWHSRSSHGISFGLTRSTNTQMYCSSLISRKPSVGICLSSWLMLWLFPRRLLSPELSCSSRPLWFIYVSGEIGDKEQHLSASTEVIIIIKGHFFTGSLVDYLKTTEGSSVSMNTLINMASQARTSALLHPYFLFPWSAHTKRCHGRSN